jgi:signal recognition particle subunit SRP54
LLQVHKQFEGMVSKMGKSGLVGKQAQARQQAIAAQMRKNPNLINQRLNQMDPRLLQQMGGREAVQQMMQQMAKGGPGSGSAGGGMMPDMSSLMGGAGGAGGIPGFGFPGMGMPPPGGGGGGGGIPQMPSGMDMETLMKMAQSMGMGQGGFPGAPR